MARIVTSAIESFAPLSAPAKQLQPAVPGEQKIAAKLDILGSLASSPAIGLPIYGLERLVKYLGDDSEAKEKTLLGAKQGELDAKQREQLAQAAKERLAVPTQEDLDERNYRYRRQLQAGKGPGAQAEQLGRDKVELARLIADLEGQPPELVASQRKALEDKQKKILAEEARVRFELRKQAGAGTPAGIAPEGSEREMYEQLEQAGPRGGYFVPPKYSDRFAQLSAGEGYQAAAKGGEKLEDAASLAGRLQQLARDREELKALQASPDLDDKQRELLDAKEFDLGYREKELRSELAKRYGPDVAKKEFEQRLAQLREQHQVALGERSTGPLDDYPVDVARDGVRDIAARRLDALGYQGPGLVVDKPGYKYGLVKPEKRVQVIDQGPPGQPTLRDQIKRWEKAGVPARLLQGIWANRGYKVQDLDLTVEKAKAQGAARLRGREAPLDQVRRLERQAASIAGEGAPEGVAPASPAGAPVGRTEYVAPKETLLAGGRGIEDPVSRQTEELIQRAGERGEALRQEFEEGQSILEANFKAAGMEGADAAKRAQQEMLRAVKEKEDDHQKFMQATEKFAITDPVIGEKDGKAVVVLRPATPTMRDIAALARLADTKEKQARVYDIAKKLDVPYRTLAERFDPQRETTLALEVEKLFPKERKSPLDMAADTSLKFARAQGVFANIAQGAQRVGVQKAAEGRKLGEAQHDIDIDQTKGSQWADEQRRMAIGAELNRQAGALHAMANDTIRWAQLQAQIRAQTTSTQRDVFNRAVEGLDRTIADAQQRAAGADRAYHQELGRLGATPPADPDALHKVDPAAYYARYGSRASPGELMAMDIPGSRALQRDRAAYEDFVRKNPVVKSLDDARKGWSSGIEALRQRRDEILRGVPADTYETRRDAVVPRSKRTPEPGLVEKAAGTIKDLLTPGKPRDAKGRPKF